jgi:hypothetical protein
MVLGILQFLSHNFLVLLVQKWDVNRQQLQGKEGGVQFTRAQRHS